MTATAFGQQGILEQQRVTRPQQPLREPADYRGTVRITDWTAGFDLFKYQDFPFAAASIPGFWDAQNIDYFSEAGTFRLCSKVTRIGTAEASDHEYLLYPFNNALYRLPMTNFDATLVQKQTDATIDPSTWTALANVYPGAVAPRGAVVWRDQWIIASADTVLRVMSTAEVWTTIAAPAGVAAPISGQVGIGQDDRLYAYWEGSAQSGLWAYDGGAWTKVYPTAGTTPGASDQTCDAIIRGAGSTIVFTRNKTGMTSLLEIAQQAAGTTFQTWDELPVRVWPQCGDVYQGDVWIVGKLQRSNRGFFMHKQLLADPEIVFECDTNFATDDQVGLDWSFRCFRSFGDVAWIGGSSREDHDATMYRFSIDTATGADSLGPVAVVDSVPGPIYSIGMLPPDATGASTTERYYFSTTKATYFKDRDNGSDPTKDADTGYIQMADIDYGTEDKLKVGNFVELNRRLKSTGGTVELQYRVDPRKLSDPWRSFGFATKEGMNHITVPNDNPAQQLYGQRSRRLQIRVAISRATSGLIRDVIDTLAYNIAQIEQLR